MTIGVFTGLISGFYGGRIDDVANAIIQTLLNIPILFLLILLSLLMRPEPPWLAFIIGITGWMGTACLVWREVFSIRERDYIEATCAVGATNRRIILRHVLPNVSSLIIVIAAFDVAGGIMVESGLSFLGVRVQPPVARPVSSSRLMKRRRPLKASVRRGISSRGVGRWPSSIRAG